MIGEIQPAGEGFRGLLNYQEEKVKKGVAERIGGNMSGKNAQELSKEFGLIRRLNRDTQKKETTKPVFHASLSLPPGERLGNDDFKRVGERFVKELGYENSQYLIYRHYDEEHPHVHVIANRIDMDGKRINDQFEKRRGEQIVRTLEKEYGLQQVTPSAESQTSALTQYQQKVKENGQLPEKRKLQHILEVVSRDNPSTELFVKRLHRRGVDVKFNGKTSVTGISFKKSGYQFKGSSLGKKFSWNNLQDEINFNFERDKNYIDKANRGERLEKLTKADKKLLIGIDKNDEKLMRKATKEGCNFDILSDEEISTLSEERKMKLYRCMENKEQLLDKDLARKQEFEKDNMIKEPSPHQAFKMEGGDDEEDDEEQQRRKGRGLSR